MKIVIDKEFKGMYSASLNKISRYVIDIFDKEGNKVGVISGDSLNEQLKKLGFEIMETDPYQGAQ